MNIPKDGYYMAKVQLDTGGLCPHYVRVKGGKLYSQWGDELLPEACSEFRDVNTTLMVRVWPEDAAMELEALRTANRELVEALSAMEMWVPTHCENQVVAAARAVLAKAKGVA